MEIVDSRNLASTVKWGNNVIRVPKHAKTTNTNNKTTENKKKLSKEEKEAEKEEKRERKREKNRRKRVAYRLKQRMKKAGPKPSKAKREEWKKENKESDKEYRKEKKRRQKAKKREEQEDSSGPRPVIDETEWSKLVEEAGDRSDFELLLELFSQHLLDHTRTSSESPLKAVTKRFRELSTRYHPDKHGNETSRYSLMFQALNEARHDIFIEFA